jgi:hypothetical protein
MGLADIAEHVLREAGGGPLHSREITGRATDAGLMTPTGETPWASINAAMGVDNRRREARRELPRFVGAGSSPAPQSSGSWPTPAHVTERFRWRRSRLTASAAAPTASPPLTHRLGLRASGRFRNESTSIRSRMPPFSGARAKTTRKFFP